MYSEIKPLLGQEMQVEIDRDILSVARIKETKKDFLFIGAMLLGVALIVWGIYSLFTPTDYPL